ncbi:MAG: YfhO family protein [Defluviitaleaceae bacterium]|nr:YfhO family protein [Defluviitaleaceae bacterium]
MSDSDKVTIKQKIILHGLSALIPILILGMAFALNGVYPFGDRQLLVTDYWHQYFPFLSDHWHRLRDGGSFLWSWTAGGGHDYLAHFAYYMASPLNFLIVLFPHAYLREVLTLLLLIRIGLAGLFMSCFLSQVLKKHDLLLPVFSAFYALCAFTLGYYWNIMWFDTIAIMPLVMLGVYALVKEGKYLLYIGALALAVFSSFYIGLFVCIFVAMLFFAQCYTDRLNRRQFLQRTITIGVSSIIALGISAIILLPVYAALQNSYRSASHFPTFRVYDSFASVFGNFIAFTPPTSLNGLPNLYSGLLSVMLVPVFLFSKKINVRERISYLAMAGFLILSVNINVLDFIWNGFTVTNMLPRRFSFIASFLVVVMAYKAYSLMARMTKKDILAMALATLFFHFMALIGEQSNAHVGYSMLLSIVYLGLFIFGMRVKDKDVFKYAVFFVILVELAFASYHGVYSVRTTSRSDYPPGYDEVQLLLTQRQLSEPDFVRTELGRPRTLNAPSLYGFNGISFFSSFANVDATQFMENIGLIGWPSGNRFTFSSTSPLTSAFLNLRYVIIRDNEPMGDGNLWEHVASEGNNHLFRNLYHLPFGFMVNEAITGYVGDRVNPFNAQNDLFQRATGLEGELFTLIDIIHVGHRDYDVGRLGLGEYTFTLLEGAQDGMFRFNYEVPVDGPLYVYASFPDTTHARVEVDGRYLHTVEIRRPYIFSAGTFQQGQLVSIEADSSAASGTGTIFVSTFDQERFRQGFEQLSAETLTLIHFSDDRVRGSITVEEPRILYTSLPYAGNWRVLVNGFEEEIITIGGAMAGVRLTAGTHIVEFRYHNQSVNLGMMISTVSLAAYVGLLWLHHRKGIDIFDTVFNRLFSSKNNEDKVSTIFLGALTVLINWVMYMVAIQAFNFPMVIGNLIAWLSTVAFAFTTHKIWLLKDTNWSSSTVKIQIKQFLSARRLTALVDLIGMPFLFFLGINQATLGIEGLEAKLVISGVIVLLNIASKKKTMLKSDEITLPEASDDAFFESDEPDVSTDDDVLEADESSTSDDDDNLAPETNEIHMPDSNTDDILELEGHIVIELNGHPELDPNEATTDETDASDTDEAAINETDASDTDEAAINETDTSDTDEAAINETDASDTDEAAINETDASDTDEAAISEQDEDTFTPPHQNKEQLDLTDS